MSRPSPSPDTNCQSLAAFVSWFVYMYQRGPAGQLSTPLPAVDPGNITYPAGYTPAQVWGRGRGEARTARGRHTRRAARPHRECDVNVRWEIRAREGR